MATKLYINYVRRSDVPTAREVRKILLREDRHIRITHSVDGDQTATDYDFTASPTTGTSEVTPNGYADTIYRYLIDDSHLHVWIACAVPINMALPKPDYQVITATGAATVFLADGETGTIDESLTTSPPDWIPGALTTSEKKARAITAIKAWREQKRIWLLESPEYADLVPNISTHLGYWLRSGDWVINQEFTKPDATRYDYLIIAEIAKQAALGPRTLDPDGDGSYNVEFFQRLKAAAASFPNGPSFGALWVQTWDLTSVSDVTRVDDFTADVIQSHGQTLDRTYHNLPAAYDSTADYWSS